MNSVQSVGNSNPRPRLSKDKSGLDILEVGGINYSSQRSVEWTGLEY